MDPFLKDKITSLDKSKEAVAMLEKYALNAFKCSAEERNIYLAEMIQVS